jgi:hypothetical protein
MIERLLEAERLLAVGMVDRAEAIFRGMAESDPRNAFAVVGLARIALERGDDRLAYRHAVHALEIDPENDAARRLEGRLAEVFAARGEAIAPAEASAPAAADAVPDAPLRPADRDDGGPGAVAPRPRTSPEAPRRGLLHRILKRR